VIGFLWFVYIVVCFLLMLIILIQRGETGGLSSAFGGGGGETAFGVKADLTWKKATAWFAGIFMLLALILGGIMSNEGGSLAAAAGAGIGLTLLPVLYMTSDFGGKPPTPGQRRFLGTPDAIVAMIDALRTAHPEVRLGLAPHSLRAVPPDALADAVRAVDAIDPTAPIHIHAAEQEKEVADCVAWSGRRPVEWLLDAHRLSPRWCVVHATHLTASETDALAASRATAGLCPTTEANLGDGLFPLARYLERGGRLGIGTDSNVSVAAIEELRWLEYGQRLAARRRNIAATASSPSPGATLYRAAIAGGAAASGQRAGGLAPGERADLVVLDPDAPFLAGRTGDTLLDALVFGGDAQPIRDVYVGGRPVVADRRHPDETVIFDRFRRAIARLGGA